MPVRVQARSSRCEIAGMVDGRVKIRTNAPPTDGRATKDVAGQLAKAFRVPASRATLKSGARSRNKTFTVAEPTCIPPWAADGAFR